MNDILESLNDVQRQAVQHTEGPLLLLSGPGSGKTRVITHRIAHLIRHHNISPFNILAVTFTNKAAGEMKTRLEPLVGAKSHQLWVSTFHSSGARILRRDLGNLGYPTAFTIYDADDQLTLIKEILKTPQFRGERIDPETIRNAISNAKDALITPAKYEETASVAKQRVAQIYSAYQRYLRKNEALDFGDLIMMTVELFESCPEVLERYQNKFKYILIDEYQDTNYSQYRLVQALAQKHQNICVVGDDDQNIYSWRGANSQYLRNFERNYPNTTTLLLEQNYRSTQNILSAAYAIVQNNHRWKEKKLWTEKETGKRLICYEATGETSEASYVIQEIKKWKSHGLKYGDCVIFYRINAQSRTFETALHGANIPYQIVGGLRFFEREEVKNVLAYLRVIVNPADTISFKRIINIPYRGIDAPIVQQVENFAIAEDIPLFEAIRRIHEISTIRHEAQEKVKTFAKLIHSFKPDDPPVRTIEALLERSGYLDFLKRQDSPHGAHSPIENVNELVTVAAKYEQNEAEPTLVGFLEMVALTANIDRMDDKSDVVTLMTLHNAKGLEFPIVFIVGIEEGTLPDWRADCEATFEEERRLCYVGITRAKKQVYLTYASNRTLGGSQKPRSPSCFINEIPDDLLSKSEY